MISEGFLLLYRVMAMVKRNRLDVHPDGFNGEVIEAIEQLGDLRDLALENYISSVIKRTDAIKRAIDILEFLETVNSESTKILDNDKKKYQIKINQLAASLKPKHLTPMERRYIYEEIANLIRDMESIRRYWIQKSIKGVKYVGAASAVAAAAIFLRKRK